MTWIKICGTTNLEDALTTVDAGADALGFVFYGKSPRNVDPGTAREIVAKLPPDILTVGVFVSQPVQAILNTVKHAGLAAVQLHGDECRKVEFIQALKLDRDLKIFVVVPADEIENGLAWTGSGDAGISAAFVDSGTPQRPGGTGKMFDWKSAASGIGALGKNVNVVVAGGLDPTNVEDAIRILKPWGVDVVSGVEAKPGKKDPVKIRAFVEAVRKAEKKN